MTTLVLEHLPALPALVRNLQMVLARFGRTVDAIVSAKAARTVPEWQLRKVRGDVNRHLGLIRAARKRVSEPAISARERSESEICNFGR